MKVEYEIQTESEVLDLASGKTKMLTRRVKVTGIKFGPVAIRYEHRFQKRGWYVDHIATGSTCCMNTPIPMRSTAMALARELAELPGWPKKPKRDFVPSSGMRAAGRAIAKKWLEYAETKE